MAASSATYAFSGSPLSRAYRPFTGPILKGSSGSNSGRSTRGHQILCAQRWIDGREFERVDQCERPKPFVEGVQSAKIRMQRAHWPSVRLRQEFVHPTRRWWPATEAVRGQFGSIHCRFSCSSLRRHRTGVSDCVLGSTVRDISGSNPISLRHVTRPNFGRSLDAVGDGRCPNLVALIRISKSMNLLAMRDGSWRLPRRPCPFKLNGLDMRRWGLRCV